MALTLILVCHLDSNMEANFFKGSVMQLDSLWQRKTHTILNYIDDLIGFGLPSSIQDSYETLCCLLTDLGLAISDKKLVPPSTRVTYLEVQIDTVKDTISVPPEKLQKITTICSNWENKRYVTKRQLLSLLGYLLHVKNV